MAEQQVRETLQFINHPRVDVRRMAVELVKSMTPVGHEARPFLKKEKAAIALAKVATDADTIVAKDATAALVNLTDDHAIVMQLVGTNFIPTLVENICAKDNKLLSLHVMLLNNITTFAEGCKKLLRPGADEQLRGFEALKLFEAFAHSGKSNSAAAEDPLGWLGSALQNLAQTSEGRTVLCDPTRHLLPQIAAFIRHPNPLRRRSSIGLIKNLLFNEECHPQALAEETRIISNAMLALAPVEAEYTAEDRAGMPNDVMAGLDDKARKAESDLTNKQLLLEAMLLLTKTKNGREVLRQRKLYPVIREMHRVDEAQLAESTTDTIGKLVECLQLPEGVDAPKVVSKVEEIEEIV